MTERDLASSSPYDAPTARLDFEFTEEYELAGRGQRLVAVLLDGLIFAVVILISILIFGFGVAELLLGMPPEMLEGTADSLESFDPSLDPMAFNLFDWTVWTPLAIEIGIYFLINGYLLHTRGQSIGKLVMKIAIVDFETREVVPLPRIILRRYLLFDVPLLINYFLSVIVTLVDTLSIFRKDCRMIHDLAAGTVVVRVGPKGPN